MIYTVTLNPALDLIISLHDPCKNSAINRAYTEKIVAGGKGVNVSRVLKVLNRDSIALGFAGGYTGIGLDAELRRLGIKTDFAIIKDSTRTNVKILVDGQEQTEINAPSPQITRDDVMNLVKKFAKIKHGDTVAFCGTLPQTFSTTIFENCLKLLSNNKVVLYVDMTGAPLLKSLKYHPFVVKLNKKELNDTLYANCKSEEDYINCAKRLLKMGAQNVIVTSDAGAFLVTPQFNIHYKAPKIKVKNSTGAGDSFLAGFIDEYIKTKSYEKALKKGIVLGAATVKSPDLADIKSIREVNQLINH